ncbi:hypothetical protein Tco_1201940, partial [Tanacetum coccineum]
MSDSEDSTVTYTQISSPFADLSDIGSPGVDGPPIMPDDPYAYVVAAFQAPPSPDYVPGPEEPQAPLPLDFVPEPVYPEFMPPDDEVLPAEEQPLPAAASPTDQSPGYIPESDPEEDPEEDDEDPEEDPADYPADRDDDNHGEEEEPSRDDADDKDEDEDEKEEEEHPAPAESVPHVHRMTARISIRAEPSISLPSREEIPSPPLPVPLQVPVIPQPLPASPTYLLGYRAAIVRLRAEAPFTSHAPPLLPILAPISSAPIFLLSTDCRANRPEFCLPPRKRLCSTQGPRYEVGESSSADAARPPGGRRADYGFVGTMDTEIRRQRAKEVGYGIRDVWVDLREAVDEVAPMTLEGVNTRVTELAAVQEQDTQDIYTYHYETTRLLDQEALVSREAWGRSIEVSYMARSDIMALRSIVMSQQAVISQLQAADHRSQIVTSEILQGEVTALQGQQGPFGGPAQLVAPEEAGSSDATRNDEDSHTWGTSVRRTKHVAQECTYQDFMKCQPLYFKGIEGVVELTQWFERMETVFRISNCSVDNHIKFSTCTLLADLRKKMTDKYYPRNEMKKLEGSVVAWKLKTMQEATEMASELMDKKINTIAERQA